MGLNFVQWLLAVGALCVLAWRERFEPLTPLRIAGAVFCVLGFAMVTLARYQLGRSFSIRARAQHLVTTGLYARLRNPIYVFAELFLLGAGLYLQSWWPIAILVIAIPIQIVRARNEAAVLQAAFGDQYRAYRAQTWF